MYRYRMNRPTYWLSLAIVVVVLIALVSMGWTHGGMEMAMLAIGVPRLHDIGRSGWVVVGVIAGEFVAIFAPLALGAGVDAVAIMAGVVFLVVIGLGVWLGCIPGESETNKWGDPPQPGVHFGGARQRG